MKQHLGPRNLSTHGLESLAVALLLVQLLKGRMLKISMIESASQCRLVVEGKLIAPWAAELKNACEKARDDLRGRKLVVDIQDLLTIDHEGEGILLDLMNHGVVLRGCGLFTRQILKQLAQRKRRNYREGARS
jgi:anti-anti-sigma regulatory factor